MLIRFSVENFLSYNEKQTFSMLANNSIKQPSNHLLKTKCTGINTLKLSAIYGANASGKSKLFESMRFSCYTLKRKLPLAAKNMFCKSSQDNETKLSTFEYEFYINNSYYAYGFSAMLSTQTIISEWLYRLFPKNKKEQEYIYEREFDKKENKYILRLNHDILDITQQELDFFNISNDYTVKSNELFISTINKSDKIIRDTKKQTKKPTNKVDISCFVEIYNYFVTKIDFVEPDQKMDLDYYVDNNIDFKLIEQLINSFDTGIVSIETKVISLEDMQKVLPEELNKKVIETIESTATFSVTIAGARGWYRIARKDKDTDIEIMTILLKHKNSVYEFGYQEESDGTQKLFELIRILVDNKDNRVYIIDELERSLHPKATERFLQLFVKMTQERKAQLIFTTHESTIMSQELLRRDEIWFVEKNANNHSTIYSLDQFSERYDRKLDKAYLDGRYGALPIFND